MSNQPLIIKICGITRLEDGLAALRAGADWLGFIRWPGSKRYREPDETAQLLGDLRERAPGPFEAVGVYVDADEATIGQEIEGIGFDRIQFHGTELLTFIRGFSLPVIKALRAPEPGQLLALSGAYPGLDLLSDAWDPDNPGGTGRTYDYGQLAELTASRRVLVAGGLTPENVAAVVRELRPYGVDVSSGVEIEPGIKDHDKVRRFIAAAREITKNQ